MSVRKKQRSARSNKMYPTNSVSTLHRAVLGTYAATPTFLCRYWGFELRPSCEYRKSHTKRGEDVIGARNPGPWTELSVVKHREPF